LSKHLKYYLFSVIFSLNISLWGQINIWQQQLKIRFDSLTNEIGIIQKTGIRNDYDKPISRLVWLNWANAYSHKHTALARRIMENYKLNFHFAPKKQQGYVHLNEIWINSQQKTEDFKPLSDDVFSIDLDKNLNSGDSLVFIFKYVVKLPHAKFTGYGIDKNKNIFLKNFYYQVIPLSDQIYSDKNIDDYPASPVLFDIKLENFRSKKNIWSNLGHHKEHLKSFAKNLTIEITDKSYQVLNVDSLQIIWPGNAKLAIDFQQKKLSEIINFIRQKHGLFLSHHVFINRQDLKNHKIYGLDLLPNFLNPYPETIKWELSILQQLAYKNLLNLNIDRRKNPWLVDGLVNYLIYSYIQTFYPEFKLIGKLANFKLLRYYYASQVKLTEKYPWLYLYMARMNKDQALFTSLDSLTNFNRNVASPYKAALGFKILQDQNRSFQKKLKKFLLSGQKKWLSPSLFEKYVVLPEQKQWFKLYFKTTSKFDYKLKKTKIYHDTIVLTIKNKTHQLLPLTIFGLNNNRLAYAKAIKSFKNDTLIKIKPSIPLDYIGLNYFNDYPELQINNNYKKVKYHLLDKGIQIRPYRDFKNPLKHQLFVNPFLAYNYYDGLIVGMQFFNESFLHNHFNYILTPAYGTKNNSLTGSFSIGNTNYFNQASLYAINYGFKYSFFHYNHNLVYRKYSPSLTFKFRSPYLRQRKGFNFKLKYLYIDKDPMGSIPDETDQYQILDFKAHFYNINVLKDVFLNTDFQLSKLFSKISTTFRYRFLTDKNRQWDFRFYLGKFIYNKTRSDYFSFALDRPSDYLFQYNYYGRSETSGIFHQQFIWAEGGFKSFYPHQFANDYIISHNLNIGLWKWFNLYTDWAWLKQVRKPVNFYYDGGIRINLIQDYFEIFLPVYANKHWEITQDNYLSKIRFIFTMDAKNLMKMFGRSWY